MKNYTITLEVLTPVYIGNGTQITKKDFELRDNYAHIYDPIKLYSILGRWYEEFLIDNTVLTDYLQSNQFNRRFNLQSALKYSVFCGDKSIRKSDGIHEFIKDPYGYPYIPGSSLKGAIRTSILAYLIKEDASNKYTEFKKEHLDRYSKAQNLEEEAFGATVDSIFKHFKISDSEPLSKDDLILSKKIDVFKDGETNNKLNLCRESLKPKTKVKFNLTIDSPYHERIFNPEQIMKAIRAFSKQYRDVYLSKFKSYDDRQYDDNTLYLGGGTGFLTKTVNHSLYKDEALKKISYYLDSKFNKHNHKKDIALGVSPRAKKCTRIKEETVEMGICSIRID